VSLEYFEANKHIDYPFTGGLSSVSKSTFVDALVVDPEQVAEGVRLNSLTLTDSSTASCVLVYASSLTDFFVGTVTASVRTVGLLPDTRAKWWIVTFTDGNKYATFTLNGEQVSTFPVTFTVNKQLAVRCIDQPVTSVKTLTNGGVSVSSGSVIFRGGYNIQFRDVGDTEINGRPARRIVIDARPGEGEGLYPSDCVGDGTVKTVNGVGPDENGDFKLGPENCLRVYRPVYAVSPTTCAFDCGGTCLKFSNDCRACCSCDDYGAVYSALTKLYNTGRSVGRTLAAVGAKMGGKGSDPDSLDKQLEMLRFNTEVPTFKVKLRPHLQNKLGVTVQFTNDCGMYGLSYDLGEHSHKMNLEVDAPNTITYLDAQSCKIYNDSVGDCTVCTPQQLFSGGVNFGTREVSQALILRPTINSVIERNSHAIIYFELMVKNNKHDVPNDPITVSTSTSSSYFYNKKKAPKSHTIIKVTDVYYGVGELSGEEYGDFKP